MHYDNTQTEITFSKISIVTTVRDIKSEITKWLWLHTFPRGVFVCGYLCLPGPAKAHMRENLLNCFGSKDDQKSAYKRASRDTNPRINQN